MRIISPFFFAALLCILKTNAQEENSFGILTPEEKSFITYEKDSTANAVVLYEKGDNYFDIINNRIQIVKKYHIKIKILNEKGFDEGNIAIPYYHNENSSEKIEEIRGVTHNGTVKTSVIQSQIYSSDVHERVTEKRFAFPSIKEGSILEYSYKLITPYIYNFKGWDFQSNIPKIYSEFQAKIPGNYQYNRSLVGSLKLAINDASVKTGCFIVPGYDESASCEVLKYAMKDIPAFREEEDYMLAASNYISRIDFELATHYALNGTVNKYTKSWKDVDNEFKTDKDIGKQLRKNDFFEKNVPEELLTKGDELTKAKNIYAFIQNHFTWNEKYGIYRDIRVKEAFEERKGNIGEINISLINLLNAAGIKTNLMLISTRNNGLPKKTHPVISDFNYVIAKAEIDGTTYLLDATDKFNPFGMLPFKCLNYYGRVMDFKNDSYWYDITIDEKSRQYIKTQISFDLNSNNAIGILDEINTGYNAINKKRFLNQQTEEEYIDSYENTSSGNFTISSYEYIEEASDDTKTSERFNYEIKNIINNDIVFLNPFFVKFFSKNPFTLEERNYPIDFGYKRNYTYLASIIIPEGYEVQELPKNKVVALEENNIALRFTCANSKDHINLSFNLSLKDSHYLPDDYPALKELFRHVINIQDNSVIVLKKK
tara:strand:+ start:54128 stop:56095 length:1968 start_codon:yes stop_codon:yes gene_type:complete